MSPLTQCQQPQCRPQNHLKLSLLTGYPFEFKKWYTEHRSLNSNKWPHSPCKKVFTHIPHSSCVLAIVLKFSISMTSCSNKLCHFCLNYGAPEKTFLSNNVQKKRATYLSLCIPEILLFLFNASDQKWKRPNSLANFKSLVSQCCVWSSHGNRRHTLTWFALKRF